MARGYPSQIYELRQRSAGLRTAKSKASLATYLLEDVSNAFLDARGVICGARAERD